jgi:hypothetical protein
MASVIQEPVKGGGVRHAWGVAVTRGINQLVPLAAPGQLVRDGAGGFGLAPLPMNRRREMSAGTDVDHGCWRIETIQAADGGTRHVFASTYTLVGNILIESSVSHALEDFAGAGLAWIALEIDSAEGTVQPAGFASIATLVAAQKREDVTTLPLYKLAEVTSVDDAGALVRTVLPRVDIDFRLCVRAQEFEVLT